MKRRIINALLAVCLAAGMAAGSLPAAGMEVKAAEGAQQGASSAAYTGLTDDDYAGYVYVCFADTKAGKDVQQVHFFLSEDGLNWTALNGCKPIFETGEDYIDYISKYPGSSVNYKVLDGLDEADIAETTFGDASVLFPFEGNDQGIRDPYLLRGAKKDGSDANKVWILATDLNTMQPKYNGNLTNNTVGNWGLMTSGGQGSRNLFVYETEDWVHWTRRYINVADQVDAYMAWAPEAIYNPVKDNYLVYWSARSKVDGGARDRLYCNETEDFVTFGPTKLYEQEPFYKNYEPDGVGSADDGYGNIDTSQLWVAKKNADGTVNPYGTLYRLVKDETNNHIELMEADTVLDPKYEGKENQAAYDATDATRITEYTDEDGNTFSSLADINALDDKTHIKTADVVYHWFINESVGNHFEYIEQQDMEKQIGAYEGATMFKFIGRDEWCIMIDFYGNNQVRYEPYTTTDLSEPNSIKKVESGYGRTGGDIGCHGGMIPITAEEYNTLIDTYNADDTIDNYHPIEYVVDKRAFNAKRKELKAAAATNEYTKSMKDQMTKLAEKELTGEETQAEIDNLVKRANRMIASKLPKVPEMLAENVYLEDDELTLCTKATDGLKNTAALAAYADLDSETSKITFTSSNGSIAKVDPKTGVVTAVKAGTANITATAPGGAKAVCSVTVKGIPSKVTLKKKSVKLKVKGEYQINASVPKGTVCSTFKYKSNKPKIAKVSKTGLVTAKKKGTAKITVTAGNNSKAKATFTVKVK